jgi:hypothetical protein
MQLLTIEAVASAEPIDLVVDASLLGLESCEFGLPL